MVPKALVIFLHSFLFFFHRPDYLNWPIFKCVDSFFDLSKSVVAASEFLKFNCYTFWLQNFYSVL
jgi:hypothetical protein